MRDFGARANQETVVCVQVEDREGLEHLREIAQVPGVDVVFLGPSDLSQALGYPGQVESPAVQSVLAAAFEDIRMAGKVSGCAGSQAMLRRYRDRGVQYLYTHLPTVFGARAPFGKRKGALGHI